MAEPSNTGYQNKLTDPTANVIALIESVAQHAAELRGAESQRVNEQMALRADYEEKLRLAEAKRIDAIRAVDVNAVAVANDRATAQASVLATQVAASAEALRTLVASTSATLQQQLAQITSQFNDRLAAVEKTQYEGKNGLNTISPQVAERLSQLEESRYKQEGSKGGMKELYAWIVAAIGIGIAIASFIINN